MSYIYNFTNVGEATHRGGQDFAFYPTNITVKVYDFLGRQFAVLVNEVREEGEYSVEFNGAELSNGVYIVNLAA